jgi:hypothetical protein
MSTRQLRDNAVRGQTMPLENNTGVPQNNKRARVLTATEKVIVRYGLEFPFFAHRARVRRRGGGDL